MSMRLYVPPPSDKVPNKKLILKFKFKNPNSISISKTVKRSKKVIKNVIEGTEMNQKVHILTKFNAFNNFLIGIFSLSFTVFEIEMLTQKFAARGRCERAPCVAHSNFTTHRLYF